MKAKNIIGKIYVSANAYLGHSETFHRGFQTAICLPNFLGGVTRDSSRLLIVA